MTNNKAALLIFYGLIIASVTVWVFPRRDDAVREIAICSSARNVSTTLLQRALGAVGVQEFQKPIRWPQDRRVHAAIYLAAV